MLTAVLEFLRFGVSHGWVPVEAVAALSEPKYLKHVPPGYDTGEFEQFRTVQASTLRFRVAEPGYETLTSEQIQCMLSLARRARDRFLIALLAVTGIRIGEALGMRRQDLHLLPGSRALGCEVEGAHVHVRWRRDNTNGALAKSRFPRSIPVTEELAGLYAATSTNATRWSRPPTATWCSSICSGPRWGRRCPTATPRTCSSGFRR